MTELIKGMAKYKIDTRALQKNRIAREWNCDNK